MARRRPLRRGDINNFFGTGAGSSNTGDNCNSFFGGYAGNSNTTGNNNSFFGASAGYSNTTGNFNSFFGGAAGYSNTTGVYNSFFGTAAGYLNTTGYYNSFFGGYAGYSNTTGYYNSFFGGSAGYSNTTGYYNSFFGAYAGYSNTTGYYNSFFGRTPATPTRPGTPIPFLGNTPATPTRPGTPIPFLADSAGQSNTVENYNTFVGYRANLDGATDSVTNATAIGSRAYVAQSNSLVLGSIAGVNSATSNVNVGIGTPAPARQLHLKGDNAVFRMDRSTDTAAFMLVRTDAGGTPQKTFVVGTNASGANTGEFVINDLGTAVAGPGTRRMTITNNGAVDFTGIVTAPAIHPDEFACLQDQCPDLRKCA